MKNDGLELRDDGIETNSPDIKRDEDIWVGRKVWKTFCDSNGDEIDTFDDKIVDVDDDEDEVNNVDHS